ncbi:Vacuolar protein sorting-associated protein 1 [Sphaceloma murrayae]|uniref:Alpha-galactosidase n=1 Tax=Sphaceloma murrayae TaxID=2082308 RepID=A0A2K1QP74_9PEZI|nr:Vacuolar protein sorting-associated protein 1 [Sphaceloma murrayae]
MAPNSITVAALLLSHPATAFLTNGLAITPQMGWNNWNTFACDVSEDLLVSTAQKMVDIGLRDAGYNYVVLDDCWSEGRYENRTLRPDFRKFPRGMKHVADSIHDLDMRFGMYSSAGKYTCAMYEGSLGFESEDARTWAEWGVDYLKYDNCYNEGQTGNPKTTFDRYAAMSRALNATGRPILYSMCNWGEDAPWAWAQTIANSWRATGDITDSFDRPDPRCPCTGDEGYDCVLPGFHCSVMNILNKVAAFPSKAQPGAWNDLDMLEVGNGGMNDEESKLHFSLWSAAKSPMLIGADVRSLSPSAYSIYTNPAALALNQDPLGSSIVRRWRYYVPEVDQYGQGEISLWAGNLWADNTVVILLNAGNVDRMMNTSLAEIYEDNGGSRSTQANRAYDLFDIWGNRMPNATAEQILSSNSTEGVADLGNYWLNTTATTYRDALARNDSIVLGRQVGTVQAQGTISALVPRHGVVAYRLRPIRETARDEL